MSYFVATAVAMEPLFFNICYHDDQAIATKSDTAEGLDTLSLFTPYSNPRAYNTCRSFQS